MEFFYSRTSGNSARSALALFEAGVPWEPRLVDPHEGETRRPPYLKLNPMGKVPALVDGETVLWESNAINWYVAEKHVDAKLLPATLAGRASVQRWLSFQMGHVTPACFEIFRATNPRVQSFWRVKGDDVRVAAARHELSRYLPVVDSALVGRQWLEDTFSLADIAYAPHLWLIDEGGFDFTPYPEVKAWLGRVLARPAWRKTAELIFP
jgi:glutathione S-transferase